MDHEGEGERKAKESKGGCIEWKKRRRVLGIERD